MTTHLEIYTDGSCAHYCNGRRNSHGSGGWAYLIRGEGKEIAVHGSAPYTTVNRMELTAVLRSLKSLSRSDYRIDLFSDSLYVVNAFRKYWVLQWEERDYLNVKNPDLWIPLVEQVRRHHIRWFWIKSHDQATLECHRRFNSRVDELARTARIEGVNEQIASWVEVEVVDG